MNGFEVLMTWSKCLRLVCYLQKYCMLWTCSYLMLVLNPSNTIMERSKCQDGTKKKLRYSRFNFSRTLWNTEHLKELASRRRFKLCRVHFFGLSTPIGALFLLISSSKTNTNKSKTRKAAALFWVPKSLAEFTCQIFTKMYAINWVPNFTKMYAINWVIHSNNP